MPSGRKSRTSSHGSGTGLRFAIRTVATSGSPAMRRSGATSTLASSATSARRAVSVTSSHTTRPPAARTMSAGTRLIAATNTNRRTMGHSNRPLRGSTSVLPIARGARRSFGTSAGTQTGELRRPHRPPDPTGSASAASPPGLPRHRGDGVRGRWAARLGRSVPWVRPLSGTAWPPISQRSAPGRVLTGTTGTVPPGYPRRPG